MTPGAGGGAPGTRVRLARLAAGMSQDQLARAAGVTRQAIAGVEAGRFDPSLRVALALAAALSEPVEDLFGPHAELAALRASTILPGGPGERGPAQDWPRRLGLAVVGDRTAAIDRAGDLAMRPGLLAATGTAAPRTAPAARHAGPDMLATPLRPLRPTLVVAGCDPALPLLEGPLSGLSPPIALEWVPCGSMAALELAARGEVHVAGAHLLDSSGGYNLVNARAALPTGGAEVIGFARWSEGLVVAPGLAGRLKSVADLAGSGAVLVNREPGSEARRLLDRELSAAGVPPGQVRGYGSMASAHMLVGSAVASGLAGCGIASEVVAGVYGLGFAGMSEERYDLVVPRPMLATPEVQGLLRVLAGRELRRQLDCLPGYDTSVLAEVVESF
ncbi:MAG: substrate-binding domain-containing protein [Acidimicrobiales bacterium]